MIDVLDEKFDKTLEEHEKELLLAYKTHIMNMSKNYENQI